MIFSLKEIEEYLARPMKPEQEKWVYWERRFLEQLIERVRTLEVANERIAPDEMVSPDRSERPGRLPVGRLG